MRNITAENILERELTSDEKGWLIQREKFALVAANEAEFGRPVIDGEPDREVGVGKTADDESDGDNYEQWKVAELKEEGEGRTPAVDFTGCSKKADYVLALRAWDMEHAEKE